MHPKSEREKDFEVIVDKPLDRTTIYYKFAFVTKTGKRLEDTGIFVHNGVTGVNEGTNVHNNVYLFVRRDDPPGKWQIVDEHLNPGNIESVTIELAAGSSGFTETDVFSRGTFHNL